jgi:hypothetical protein
VLPRVVNRRVAGTDALAKATCQSRVHQMTENPYQSPGAVDDSTPISTAQRKRALATVRIPAVIVVALGILSILQWTFFVPGSFPALNASWNGSGMAQGVPLSSFMFLLTLLASNAFTVYGAICMLRLRSLGLAQVAMALALLPCCSPMFFYGIPFGIWGLIVLYLPHVTAEFDK